MSELCGSGWLVKPERRVWSPLGSFMFTPDLGDLNEALLAAHEAKGDPKLALNARDFAMEYSWDRVLRQYWGSVIDRLAEELTVKTRQPIPTGEIRMMLDAQPFEGEVQEVVNG